MILARKLADYRAGHFATQNTRGGPQRTPLPIALSDFSEIVSRGTNGFNNLLLKKTTPIPLESSPTLMPIL